MIRMIANGTAAPELDEEVREVHLPHDLPPRPAPDGVDAERYERLVY